MNVLIVGLGYAGKRFLRSLQYVVALHKVSLSVAYIAKSRKDNNLLFFDNVATALEVFKPDLVIVAVNDEFHAEILNQLHDFKGFVICEKPLANNRDDLNYLANNLAKISGFCFDLIERYSKITIKLKNHIADHQLKLIRAHFYWGKDRINDYRPTCGVTSEVIHALDLIKHLIKTDQDYRFNEALGTRSDFSISGSDVLDSIMLTGYLGEAVITGYSSFVNITRKREIDLTFTTPTHNLIFARMVFDTPEWDIDYLRVWEKTCQGDHVLLEINTEQEQTNMELQTIGKLVDLVEGVVLFVQKGTKPKLDFPNLEIAIQLQKTLNEIEAKEKSIGPVKYVNSPTREFLIGEHDLERLG